MNKRLKNIRHVVMDMDGTIYCGNELFPETKPFLNLLEDLNISYTFLTNNSSQKPNDYVQKLKNMGITVNSNEIITSTINTIDYLHVNHPDLNRVYVVGTDNLRKELSAHGFEVVTYDPEAVITGFDTALSYEHLCQAAYWIKSGRLWIATHPDVECPTNKNTVLVDCGGITACLEAVCGCRAIVLGKPDPSMIKIILNRHNLTIQETVMIGDRMQTDMRLARSSGVLGVRICKKPTTDTLELADITVCDLQEFGAMLKQAKFNK